MWKTVQVGTTTTYTLCLVFRNESTRSYKITDLSQILAENPRLLNNPWELLSSLDLQTWKQPYIGNIASHKNLLEEARDSLLVEDFRRRSVSTKGVFNPPWSRDMGSVHSSSTSAFSNSSAAPSNSCYLQLHTAEVQLQVLFCLFNSSAVMNMESDTFPFLCSRWARSTPIILLCSLLAYIGFPAVRAAGACIPPPLFPQCTVCPATSYTAWLQLSDHI